MTEMTLEEVRKQYLEVLGKEPRNQIKNNIEAMQKEIEKARVVSSENTENWTKEEVSSVDETKTEEVDAPDAPSDETIDQGEPDAEPVAPVEEEVEEGSVNLKIRKIQQFYGINTVDLYEDDKLKAHEITKAEMTAIKKWRADSYEVNDIVLDINSAPDYIQEIIRFYGITIADLKSEKLIKAVVYGKATKADAKLDKKIHQLNEYYLKLVKENTVKSGDYADTYL